MKQHCYERLSNMALPVALMMNDVALPYLLQRSPIGRGRSSDSDGSISHFEVHGVVHRCS